MRLSQLKPGETAVVTKILGHGAFLKRVMEMGFVKGTGGDDGAQRPFAGSN